MPALLNRELEGLVLVSKRVCKLRDGVDENADSTSVGIDSGHLEYPLVSIIVLCYNNSQYLMQAVDSILSQDYRYIELIVSDDASTEFDADAVACCLGDRLGASRKAVVNVNSQNMGTVKHCEQLISYASGDIVLMLACDDALSGDFVISSVVGEFMRLGEGCNVVTTQIEMRNSDLSKKESDFLSESDKDLLLTEDPEEIYFRLAKSCFIPAPGTFFRKSVLEQVRGLSERYRIIEDYPLYCRLARRGVVFHYLDIVSTFHRAGGVSQSASNSKIQRIFLRDKLMVLATELFPYRAEMPQPCFEELLLSYEHALSMLAQLQDADGRYGEADNYEMLLDVTAMAHSQKTKELIAQCASEKRRRYSVEKKLNGIKGTFSWRITKPLRIMKGFVRRR